MESLKSSFIRFLGALLLFAFSAGCQKKTSGDDTGSGPPESGPVASDVEFYLTQPDQFQLFKKQQVSLLFSSVANQFPTIQLDETRTYQTIEGFGYSLTGGSAMLINALPAKEKEALLRELFLPDSSGIGISYLRISLGASDLSMVPFTYDDMPAGQTDPSLKNFTLDRERTDLIPLLKQILGLNPEIRLMASPWTAPTWMKTNNSFVGGSLRPEYYEVYARYLVKYLQEMEASGIPIDALTPQNEPLHGGNNPSMVMQASEQAAFIRDHLGPALEAAGIRTKIIIYDHNADRPDYPISVLNDPEARKYISGSAFHLYGGSISALSTVHQAHPDKGIYFTEQWVGGPGNFGGDLQWHVTNLIIGATRNWSRNV
ncbi:MAG TPA: glucosylceramidase, partial [Sphingobacteriaceae bacterium]